jgi:hypothetical protein
VTASSDFVVVNARTRMHRGGPLALGFVTRDRGESAALLDLELLGGHLPGESKRRVVVIVNGVTLSAPIIGRWDRTRFEFTRRNQVIPAGTLRAGNNRLVLEPRFESAGDYLFVGTIVVLFRRAD